MFFLMINLHLWPAGGMSHVLMAQGEQSRKIGLGAEGCLRKFPKNSLTVLAQNLLLLL